MNESIRGSKSENDARRAAIEAALARVLDSGCYLHGREVPALETEFAAYLGVRDAVATGSGTDALWLALWACGVGPGDEVITCSHTAVATVAAIELAGATPVLVDIDPSYYTLDPARLQAAISPRTKAVLPVHLYGQPCDMDAILKIASENNLHVVEDAAQAHGATWQAWHVGTFGTAGCFSFYPTKNLGALGDAGMVVTKEASLAEKLRRLREYGWDKQRISQEPGANSRMDELQAAVLRAKLTHLEADNVARSQVAGWYNEGLRELPLGRPKFRESATHVFHQYVIETDRRDELKVFLQGREIRTGIHYPVPVHLQPAYRQRVECRSAMEVTERVASRVLSLPVSPQTTCDEVRFVVDAITAFYNES